jgi:MFS family permease
MFASLFIIVFMMPFYLTYPCGFSASKTGMIMTVPFIVLFFISPVSGSLYDKIGSRLLCCTGMLIIAAALFSFVFMEPAMPLYSILWRLVLAGTGTAVFISPNSSAAMSAISVDKRGIASAAVATARNLGMVAGVAFAGLIFGTTFSEMSHGASLGNYSDAVEPFFMAGFHRAMLAGVVIALTGSIVSYMRGCDKPGNHKQFM